MDKVVTTALLTIAAVLASIMVINTMLPALGKSGASVLSSSTTSSKQVKTNLVIIAVLTDTSAGEIYAWVKNVGAEEIESIELSDIFIQSSTSFNRIQHDTSNTADNCSTSPTSEGRWVFCYENSEANWSPADTIKITISVSNLSPGNYMLQFTTNNGVTAHKTFSI